MFITYQAYTAYGKEEWNKNCTSSLLKTEVSVNSGKI